MASEDDVRRIVREEICKAFQALQEHADGFDDPDTAEIDARAFRAIVRVAEATAMTVSPESYCDRCAGFLPEHRIWCPAWSPFDGA